MRNRIIAHRRVRAGDLIPHEANPRIHSAAQRHILALLYEEIGFARSLLVYELPDGRLQIIDGHLRAEMTPDAILDVEVLDVTPAEAQKLLLAIDPLAQLAAYDAKLFTELCDRAERDSAALQQLHHELTAPPISIPQQSPATAIDPTELSASDPSAPNQPAPNQPMPEQQFHVLVECPDEASQVALLDRLTAEGYVCHAKLI